MPRRAFKQVDVFTDTPYAGNPVAVVLDGYGLSAEQMQTVARWTNLSETTFVLPPTTPEADYRVRIFTPDSELPFAGHPTLGTCHAWLEFGGSARDGVVTQECGVGLVPIRQTDRGLAFAAPPLMRSGAVEEDLVARIAGILRIGREAIIDAQWVDNGPGWVAVQLADAKAVLDVRPAFVEDLFIGVVGQHPQGSDVAIEVRAFIGFNGANVEDPVTGSLNASLAQWLLSTGKLSAPYVAAQGTAIGRRGRVHVSQEGDQIWVAGGTHTLISGQVDL